MPGRKQARKSRNPSPFRDGFHVLYWARSLTAPLLGRLSRTTVANRLNPLNHSRRPMACCGRSTRRGGTAGSGPGLLTPAKADWPCRLARHDDWSWRDKPCQELSFPPCDVNPHPPHPADPLEIVSCPASTSSRPSHHVVINVRGRCNCFAEHRALVGCLICIPFTVSNVTSGMLRKVVRRPISSSISSRAD
jgi:hypothetical protein